MDDPLRDSTIFGLFKRKTPDSHPISTIEEFIKVDKATGNLVIRNGLSCITLEPNGVIRLSGIQIASDATELIDMQSPRIDLN